jgi:hypothetical protein
MAILPQPADLATTKIGRINGEGLVLAAVVRGGLEHRPILVSSAALLRENHSGHITHSKVAIAKEQWMDEIP